MSSLVRSSVPKLDIRPHVGYVLPENAAVRLVSLFAAARFGSKVGLAERSSAEFLNSRWRTFKSKFLSVISISLNRLIERLV